MSEMIRTDVTAVKFYDNCVFAGIGSSINIFDRTTLKLIQKLNGLKHQKIYGFVPYENKILVFGGKQFTIITNKTETKDSNSNKLEKDSNMLERDSNISERDSKTETKDTDSNKPERNSNTLVRDCNKTEGDSQGNATEYVRLFEPVICDDWLHSGVWMNENVIALLTAHNVVQKWDTSTQTLLSVHPSTHNSILYSGLLLKLQDDVLVLAGTVYSEVLIHKCGEEPLHYLKGHKGVIFSISCDPSKHLIVTTSDDRSVRLWGPESITTHPYNTTKYWENITIVCKQEVYGHLARVMRNCIANDLIISVGEDSAICYWDNSGKLLKKVATHQNGAIWAVDENKGELLTGGGDCGVIIHPLSIATDYSSNEIVNIDINTPKKVVFTARKNLVVMDDNVLVYYNIDTKNSTVFELKHESTYKLLSVSNCKQLIAVSDMKGKLDIFVERCKDSSFTNVINTKLNLGKILSMQWAGNRHLVFCSDNGIITVLASNGINTEIYTEFLLPPCKERWLTSCTIDPLSNNRFIVGDRCGSIHIYLKGQKDPVKSFSKVHGRYGPTSINVKNNEIITTGRDGTIKYFNIRDNIAKYMNSKDLPFEWVEKFIDKDENVICGFQERVFIVYNVKNNNKMVEVPCGGGHRSWDALRYVEKINDNYEEFIKLVYLKNSDVNITKFQLSNAVSRNLINGSHSKEINCLKAHTFEDWTVYITGGEDTTLRISSVNTAMEFKDEVCFKHLSSIRTLKTYPLNDKNDNFLLISAGGRAQICIKDIKFIKEDNNLKVLAEELIDFQIKGTDKERKGNQTWRNCTIDFDPEMRIMDIDLIKDKDNIFIFAGCSDAYLRVFTYKDKRLELIKDSKYHATCVLKTKCFKILDKDILITCTTTGEISLWDINNIINKDLTPFFTTKSNKSGINSLSYKIITETKVLISTAGDDNAIHLILIELSDQHNKTSANVLSTWNCSNYHSSEITGLFLMENYLVSTSIDQRITLLKWRVSREVIECVFVKQMCSDIADIQGMDVLENNCDEITVCVYGKGLQVVSVPTAGAK